MILVDTSVWVDHLHRGDRHMRELLHANEVCTHELILGELAMGNIRQRDIALYSLQLLPRCRVASHAEVLGFVEGHKLYGGGLGYIDAHLIAAALLDDGTRLWTRDKRLAQQAARHSVSYAP
ncbi:MAG: type II toxin-antitoxin system VapC family toxin [Acidobacteriaceae bacterium]